MKTQTSKLKGAALDWAVATIEYGGAKNVPAGFPAYSESWAQGGPIIDREMIATSRGGSYAKNFWMAFQGFSDERIYGPTPLIAAMRCYVAFKLGDEVDLPNALINEEEIK